MQGRIQDVVSGAGAYGDDVVLGAGAYTGVDTDRAEYMDVYPVEGAYTGNDDSVAGAYMYVYPGAGAITAHADPSASLHHN